eukprot:4396318-Pyramimonas_sp.AAC.1
MRAPTRRPRENRGSSPAASPRGPQDGLGGPPRASTELPGDPHEGPEAAKLSIFSRVFDVSGGAPPARPKTPTTAPR